MTVNQQPSLDDVLDRLRVLDEASIRPDSLTTQFLEVRKSGDGVGVSVNGNQGGLVHFARLVLEVAKKGFVGAHQHFDETGEMDYCEVPLVIGFKPADWDVQ